MNAKEYLQKAIDHNQKGITSDNARDEILYIQAAQTEVLIAISCQLNDIATQLMHLNDNIGRNGLTVEIVNSEYR
jgi:hypothetical protein